MIIEYPYIDMAGNKVTDECFTMAHIDMIEYDPDRWWFGIYILIFKKEGPVEEKMEDVSRTYERRRL